jgi:hypothetical protein
VTFVTPRRLAPDSYPAAVDVGSEGSRDQRAASLRLPSLRWTERMTPSRT